MLSYKRHCVFNIQVHIVLVVKYRKKILSKKIIELIEDEVKELSNKYSFCVVEIGFGTDHIHLLVSYEPKISISQIVRVLKQETTNNVWHSCSDSLSKEFWKHHVLWRSGYFVKSVGDCDEDMIKKYILNQ